MATGTTALLGLALPVQGELSGQWGDVVNNYITTYLDSAIAGTNAISLTADVTLTKTVYPSSLGSTSSQYAILNVTPNASTWTLTVPAASQVYVVNNLSGTYTFSFKASGGTAVTFAANEKAVMAWNGSNFIKVASSAISNLTGTLPVANGGTGLTSGTSGGVPYYSASGTIASSTALNVNGVVYGGGAGGAPSSTSAGSTNQVLLGNTASAPSWGAVSLTAAVSGTLPVANGGTGVTTSTGTGSVVLSTSPTLVTPALGTPTSGSLGSCTNIPVNQAIGNLSVSRLNSGTGASSSTFWRGDGTWATPAVSAAGSNTQVQYNSSGALAGSSSLVFVDSGTIGLGIGNDPNGNTLRVYGSRAAFQDGTYSGTIGKGSVVVSGGAVTDFGISSSTGNIIFGTGGTLTEKMRLTSSGVLLINQTTNAGLENVYGQTLYTSSTVINHPSGASATDYIVFGYNATAIGSIVQNGTTQVSYNTSSDYRLKDNVQPMTGALATVTALKPVTYTWKADGSKGQGFIAHELAEVCPNAVTGNKDEVDEKGKPKYQGVDTSFLVATLTAAIKEQQVLIEALINRVTQLENN